MQYFIRTLKFLAKTKLGIYVRYFLNIQPASMNLAYSEVSSDLFLWRDIHSYENFFNLSHLGPILNPFYTNSYMALVEVFDSEGFSLGSQEFKLKYGEAILLDINEIICRNDKYSKGGTFAIFHLVNIGLLFDNEKICVAERGLASYRLKSDISTLMSSVHGNANAIACCPKTKKIRLLGCFQKKLHQYRCQLDLGDALYTELIVVNFLSESLDVNVYEYRAHDRVMIKQFTMPPGGMVVLDSRFDFNFESIIEFESHLNFLRPVIFKYYSNHFDVLHG